MPNYTATVSATSNAVGNTEDRFIEILAAAGSGLKIKRVKVYDSELAADTVIRGRLCTASDAGATGTGGTAGKKDPAMRASSATVNIKNGTNAFSVGTVTIVHARFAINGRSIYEWIPRDENEVIRVPGASYFILLLEDSAAADVLIAELEWED